MNNQEKLEAFGPYCNKNVKCYVIGECDDNDNPILFSVTGFEKSTSGNIWIYTSNNACHLIEDVNLILRPLSDLTKPCLEGGKVPIVELGRIVELLEPVSYNEMTDFKGVARGVCAKDKFNNQWLMYNFDEGFSMWHKPHGCPDHVLTLLDHQLQLFQQLYKWHFWLGDQSEFGKSIIDINTINNETR